MIRKTNSQDASGIRDLIAKSGLFHEDEVETVFGVYQQFYADALDEGHQWAVFEEEGQLVGVAYFAPEALSNNVWNLYFIAVLPDSKGTGIGKQLVSFTEQQASAAGGRLLIVETSSLDSFEPTRAFYARCGFEEAGRIRDYYGDGEAKVIFLKDLR